MTDLVALKAKNENRWVEAKTIRDFSSVARRLIGAKARYQSVEKSTGVPWYFIAVVHEREASQHWDTQLGQGDPLNKVSVHIPAGRGPFSTWEEGAIDALVNCAPYAARNKDWSIGGTLTKLEEYNGLGYASRGVPSPYVWSGTDQYRSGKYVRDGVYDADVIDQQLGCAGLLMAMTAIDQSIKFAAPASQPVLPVSPKPAPVSKPPIPKPAPVPSQGPSITRPAPGSIGAAIASLLSSILSAFKRKP